MLLQTVKRGTKNLKTDSKKTDNKTNKRKKMKKTKSKDSTFIIEIICIGFEGRKNRLFLKNRLMK